MILSVWLWTQCATAKDFRCCQGRKVMDCLESMQRFRTVGKVAKVACWKQYYKQLLNHTPSAIPDTLVKDTEGAECDESLNCAHYWCSLGCLLVKVWKSSTTLWYPGRTTRSCWSLWTCMAHHHHIRFWYLRCCGCPGLRGGQHLATSHTRSPWIPV